MKRFGKAAGRLADGLSPGENAHIIGGEKQDLEDFIKDLLDESASTEKQIEALTKERQMDIMLSPDHLRRSRIVSLLEAVENVDLRKWPLIRPLWMVVAMLEGCSVCQAMYYIRSGFVRVFGERQWLASALRDMSKSVQKSFVDPDELEEMQDDDEALKFTFDNAITNPDSLILCRRYVQAAGGFETLDRVRLKWAGDEEVEDCGDVVNERPPGIPPAHPTKKNLQGYLELEQVNQDSKLLSWLYERSASDDTICWPMVYFDLRPFYNPEKRCKEASS